MSPRPASVSASRSMSIESPTPASLVGPVALVIAFTVVSTPWGRSVTLSPTLIVWPHNMPAYVLPPPFWRSTHWIGRRAPSWVPAHAPASLVSKASMTVWPLYQGEFAERSTTLSPISAETGMTFTEAMSSSLAMVLICSTTLLYADSSQLTASILFAATMIDLTPSRAAMQRWRRVCSLSPLATSSTTSARSAVDAPVAMLRVYCTCPGQSAIMNFRLGVVAYRYATSIVMPCSRSARSPSVTKLRSRSPTPRFSEAAWTASNWSSKSWRVSTSKRPISVDFPSSTEPTVARRRRSFVAVFI